MLRDLRYGPEESLQDDAGHAWYRVSDWLEPDDAERLIQRGIRFAIQRCSTAPVAGRTERFKRDIRARMLSRIAAEICVDANTVPTIMVGEQWHSEADGDLLLFVEQGPFSRSPEELQNDW